MRFTSPRRRSSSGWTEPPRQTLSWLAQPSSAGTPLAADFLRLTIEKLREPVLAAGAVTAEEFAQAVAALQDPDVTVVAPMTVAAWGRRPLA